jgi:hypothetical protein
MKKKMPTRIKVTETPKILETGEYESVMELDASSNELFVKTIVEDCVNWGSTIQITEWGNKSGYDITQCGSHGSFQHMSITKEEADIIINILNRMK